MMAQPFWVRPGLRAPAPIDTVIFDVDGVLWDTDKSFDVAVMQTVTELMAVHSPHIRPRPVTREELRTFRSAGGLNNDWDMTFTLTALRLAGRDDYVQAARESQGRGRSWAQELIPTEHSLAYENVVEHFNQIYWGADAFERHFGRPAAYHPDAEGTWHHERPLIRAELFDQLRSRGILHHGIATGRSQVELNSVMAFEWLAREFDSAAVMTGDRLAKPDGQVLEYVARALKSSAQKPPAAALYCGDTRDDLDVVLNYRDLGDESKLWIGAVGVMPESEWPLYKEAGSDILIESIHQLPDLLPEIDVRSVPMEGRHTQ